MLVITKEGLSAFTRMPWRPKSTAICLVRMATAPFDAE
jgi:hypothetical protein